MNTDIERICFREFRSLVARSPKYIHLAACMYARSLDDARRSCLMRAAYCLARHVDDVVDGDRMVEQDRSLYVGKIIKQIEEEKFDLQNPISRLAKYVLEELDRIRLNGDDPKREYLGLFSRMVIDRERAQHNIVYDEETLHEHVRQTLTHAQNITLIISGSRMRGGDVLDLVDAQGRLYNLRDVKEDLSSGLVNIPSEVLDKTGAALSGETPPERVLREKEVRKWMRRVFTEGQNYLQRFSGRLPEWGDAKAKKTLKPLLRGLRFLAYVLNRKLNREFPVE